MALICSSVISTSATSFDEIWMAHVRSLPSFGRSGSGTGWRVHRAWGPPRPVPRAADPYGRSAPWAGRGHADLALDAAQRRRQVDAPVLEQQRSEVLAVEQLDAHHRVQLTEPAQLAVLLAHQALLQRGQLEVQVEFGQVEVGREALNDITVEVPQDREGPRLVLPRDLVVVEDARQLLLAGMGEAGDGLSPCPRGRAAVEAMEERTPRLPRSPSRSWCITRTSSAETGGAEIGPIARTSDNSSVCARGLSSSSTWIVTIATACVPQWPQPRSTK